MSSHDLILIILSAGAAFIVCDIVRYIKQVRADRNQEEFVCQNMFFKWKTYKVKLNELDQELRKEIKDYCGCSAFEHELILHFTKTQDEEEKKKILLIWSRH